MKKSYSLIPLVLLLHATAVGSDASQPSEESQSRPNILLVMSDDMGWSDLGCYGGEIATSNLDDLATGGKQFMQFYNTARCCPTRASLLTGLYPHQAGVGHMLHPTQYPGYSVSLSANCLTMAEVVQPAGYSTYAVGKWHISGRINNQRPNFEDWPLQRGFDKYYGTISGYGSFYDPATLTRGNTWITPENDPRYHPEDFYYTDAISDNAVMFLQEHQMNSPDKPFFMYVAYTAAHWPMHAPEDAVAEYHGKYDEGYDAVRQARLERLREMNLISTVDESEPTVGKWNDVDHKAWEARGMEVYAAMVSRMDQGIGKIVAQLRASGELDNTLILFLQDNGACAESAGLRSNRKQPYPANQEPMGPDELQGRTRPPMQTRDGRPVKFGPEIMPGPADSYIAYGENWANVCNTPFRKYKHFVHEGGISTPLIAHWPERIRGGSNGDAHYIRTPCHLIDIMATVVDLTGAEYPGVHEGRRITPMQGESLVPLLKDRPEAIQREEPIFFEHEGNRAIRDGKWKLVALEKHPWELYDISIDRGEMNNLADEYPARVESMAAQWKAWAERTDVTPVGAFRLRRPTVDPDTSRTEFHLESGDSLSREECPALSERGIEIRAHVAQHGSDGVLICQGGRADGYAIYVKENRLHFAVRRGRNLTEAVLETPVPRGESFTVHAMLTLDGAMTLTASVSDETATQLAGGPLLVTPVRGLRVGSDDDSPVGDYPDEFKYQGKIERVIVKVLEDE